MSRVSDATAALIEERVVWLDSEMEAVIASASPDLELYRWARYHLGWYSQNLEPLSPTERRKHGGKRLRGVLTLLGAEGVGGDGRAAAPGGAAVEFIHNFSLVHDDVEDNDEERRHRPTVWKLWGIPHAINVGSNMQALVDLSLLRLADRYPAERLVSAFRTLTHATLRMTEGQFLDMSAENSTEVTVERYFRMTGGKTAALIEGALRLGGQLGGAARDRAERLAEFGRHFGLAFQCCDDYLGMWGRTEVTGKPVAADLIQGKRSLPMVHALVSAPADTEAGARLRIALAERDVPAADGLMRELGTPTWVLERAEEHTRLALESLTAAELAEPFGGAIRDIAQYALQRDS